MTNWEANKVRQTFLDFFIKENNHLDIKSSSVVPRNDPTLLFANAGMNQFKKIFLGQVEESEDMYNWKSAANSQKCIRAGGKHNDLDDVGKDTYHHTFFEMLGNWSFGDYFKEKAIDMAWTLLTEKYGLEKDRIYVSYYSGENDVPADEEAKRIWLKYLPEERVLPFGNADNFWEMGDTGPCGPCSEIHYDRIGGRDAAKLVNADDPNVIEIWNLVFIQFNREIDGELRKLPAQHVDTGMGFERLTSILQNKTSNYDTDIFTPIFDEIQKLTGVRAYTGKVGEEDKDGIDTAYRVIADHIRTLVIALADGGVPGATGRDYVLRRIVRRAVRFGNKFMNANVGFFVQLVDVVVDQLGKTFDISNVKDIKEIIQYEEDQFSSTLKTGEAKLKKLAKKAENKIISGYDAFILYNSYGYPIDLTEIVAEELGCKVDRDEFEVRMEKLKEESIASQKKSAGSLKLQAEQTAYLVDHKIPTTNEEPKYSWDNVNSKILAIYIGNNEFVDTYTAEEGNDKVVGIILDQTAFYCEDGGQVSDIGTLGDYFEVADAQRFAGYVLHIGTLEKGTISVGEDIASNVNFANRRPIAANHTATHALNFAIRDVLKANAEQHGSKVAKDKFRFDFNLKKAMKAKQLVAIEKRVQQLIDDKLPVYKSVEKYVDATKIQGLRQMFDAKYGEQVSVISIGQEIAPMIADPSNDNWLNYSVEFCGGTHIKNTETMKSFAILQETGVGSGVRRIIAATGDVALRGHAVGDEMLAKIQKAMQISDDLVEQTWMELKREKEHLEGIPVSKKEDIEVAMGALWGRVKKIQKKAAKGLNKRSQTFATQVINKIGDSTLPIIAHFDAQNFPSNADGNMKQFLTKFRKSMADTPVCMISEDVMGEKIRIKMDTPNPDVLSSKTWLDTILAVFEEGKGGGKPTSTVGLIPSANVDAQKVIAKAQEIQSSIPVFQFESTSAPEKKEAPTTTTNQETAESIKAEIVALQEENQKLNAFVQKIKESVSSV
eukprot:CAMPEP_0117426428 /NCGR_PEP_ID=MMETSP0758-20121206/6550_1 /TAXON_ID=63605 /ORGANISM="Percolomonas cosmopolitus, Strain AE-1 (ATCC 50343)" /LENGTH=1000 /DNA_ID=CAMNT_0005211603 /DNA_START=237 /DNA_END=3239 /DNA_ORIENTATION=-